MPGVWVTVKAVGMSPSEVVRQRLIPKLRLLLGRPEESDGLDPDRFNTNEGLMAREARLRASDVTVNLSTGSIDEPSNTDPVLFECRIHSCMSPAWVADEVRRLTDACAKLGLQLFDGERTITPDGIAEFVERYFVKPICVNAQTQYYTCCKQNCGEYQLERAEFEQTIATNRGGRYPIVTREPSFVALVLIFGEGCPRCGLRIDGDSDYAESRRRLYRKDNTLPDADLYVFRPRTPRTLVQTPPDLLNTQVPRDEMGVRTAKGLEQLGIRTFGDFTRLSLDMILMNQHVRHNAARLAAYVGSHGLRLAPGTPQSLETLVDSLREYVDIHLGKDRALRSALTVEQLRGMTLRDLLFLPGMTLTFFAHVRYALGAAGLELPSPATVGDWRLELPLDRLGLYPAHRQALAAVGVRNIGELLALGEESLCKSAAFGPYSLEELQQDLDLLELQLA